MQNSTTVQSDNIGYKTRYLVLSVVVASFFWIFESLIHAFVFENGHLLEQLLHPTSNELWMRILIMISVFLLSFTALLFRGNLKMSKLFRESQARYKGLFDTMTSGVAIYKPVDDARDFVFVDFNQAGSRINNITRQEVIGKRITEAFPGVSEFGLLKVLKEVCRTGEARTFPLTYYRDERISGYFENHVFKLSSGELVAVYDDLTEKKEDERQLKHAKEYAERIVETTPSAIFTIDKEKKVTSWNKRAEEITGYKASEVIGKSCRICTNRMCIEGCSILTSDKNKLSNVKCWIKNKDGKILTILKNASVFLDEEGKVTGGIECFNDVTEVTRIKQAFDESEEKYESTFNNAPMGVVHVDSRGNFIRVNPEFCRMTGYNRQEILDMTIMDLTHPKDIDVSREKFSGLVRGDYDTFSLEKRYIKKDGSLLWGRLAVSRLSEINGELLHTIGVVDDISDKKEVELRLKKLTKKINESTENERKKFAEDLHDSVGQIINAAKINIIAFKKQKEGGRHHLDVGLKYLDKASEELKNIYSNIYPSMLKDLGLEPSIRWNIDNYLTAKKIKTKFLYYIPHELPEKVTIQIYRILQEIFSNIVRHSHSSNVLICLIQNEAKGLKIEVTDNGMGFEYERVNRGLGLASIRQRVENFQGEVKINASPGHGCSISIFLPLGSIYE